VSNDASYCGMSQTNSEKSARFRFLFRPFFHIDFEFLKVLALFAHIQGVVFHIDITHNRWYYYTNVYCVLHQQM
jgi:hypothetical protein